MSSAGWAREGARILRIGASLAARARLLAAAAPAATAPLSTALASTIIKAQDRRKANPLARRTSRGGRLQLSVPVSASITVAGY